MEKMIVGKESPRRCVRCGTKGVSGGPMFKMGKDGRLHCIKCHNELFDLNLCYRSNGPFVDIDPTFILGELPQAR